MGIFERVCKNWDRVIAGVRYIPLDPYGNKAELWIKPKNESWAKVTVIDRYTMYDSPFKKEKLIGRTVTELMEIYDNVYANRRIYY